MQEIRVGFASALGSIIHTPENTGAGAGVLFARLHAAPTASAAGYAPGCIFVNTAGSLGTLAYINVGTNTSAIWLNIA